MSSILYYFLYSLAVYTASTVLLFMLSTASPLCGFIARLLSGYACLIISACYGVIVSASLRLLGYHRLSQWATGRFFAFLMSYLVGVTFTIDDPHDYLNKTRPAVFIGNHQTELDVLMLGTIFPKYCSVTAKSSLKRVPFLGWFMSLSGSVFINRGNSKSAREAMKGAADEMTMERQSVYMFPEGTRSYYKEPGLLPFKKGAFHLAVEAGVPIVPVVVANYSDKLYAQERVFKSGAILVKVLKPIETKGLTAANVEDLTRDTRELMLRELLVLTARQRGQPVREVPYTANNSEDGVVKASGTEATLS